MPVELLGLSVEELRQLSETWGEHPYRGNQLYHALYAERRSSFPEMTNLSQVFRQSLEKQAQVTLPTVERKLVSADGTTRYVLGLGDGKLIETVWMPEGPDFSPGTGGVRRAGGRQTICVSTQAGCAVDCHFCATSQLGFLRHLTCGEIVGQVLLTLEDNRARLHPHTNVVFMGQGEPLLNYEATVKAVRLLADSDGMNIPVRRLTLSTSGIIPGIQRLGREAVRPKLAISLNATTDEVRTELMPINRKYPLADLLRACRNYPLRPWERLTFEYVLLRGVNDSREDARRLVKLVARLRTKVNLIPWNPAPGLPYQDPPGSGVLAFQNTLREAGILAFIRRSRGQDVFAACGQLALLELAEVPSSSPASLE